jgi:hypothetical protein
MISFERAITLEGREAMDNLEEQHHQKGTRGTTILRDL